MPVFGNLGAFVGLRFKFSMFLWEVDGVHLDARTNYLLFYSRLQVQGSGSTIYSLHIAVSRGIASPRSFCNSEV